jgi:creatinine amidohydrolase
VIRRYAELRPEELAAAFTATPVAIVPIGVLEWHGAHLPLGLDGLVAGAFAERLADRTGAVLLPTSWHAVTALPHPASLSTPTVAMRALWDAMVEGLAAAGARVVCLVSGHYAQGHMLELYATAVRAAGSGCHVLAATPLEPLDDQDLLDHAGRIETSLLLAVRPDLVALDRFRPGPVRTVAVLGRDPRAATAGEGEELLAAGLTAWAEWIASALEGTGDLPGHYAARRGWYEAYRARFAPDGDWELGIDRWWKTVDETAAGSG